MKPIIFLIAILFFANACHEGAGNMADDENLIDTLPVDTIAINQDSLNCAHGTGINTVPNFAFSDSIGEVIIFADSTKMSFDTIVCINNELSHLYVDGWVDDFCLVSMNADYLTNWLSASDSTILEFRHESGYPVRPWFASIIGGEFCVDYFNDGVFSADSTQINDHYIERGIRFECVTETCDCNIAEAFIIEFDEGLVAFRRNGVWFTRFN